MGEVVRLVAPVAAPVSRGCNVADNRRSGFVLLYKSLKEAPFYRDPVRKALWLHLLLEAAHERCEVAFNGNRLLCCSVGRLWARPDPWGRPAASLRTVLADP